MSYTKKELAAIGFEEWRDRHPILRAMADVYPDQPALLAAMNAVAEQAWNAALLSVCHKTTT